jgi:hypothetical protein
VPCSFNTKEEMERPEIFECKRGVEITYELRNSCWMRAGDNDIINVYQHKNSNTRGSINEQGRVGFGTVKFQLK